LPKPARQAIGEALGLLDVGGGDDDHDVVQLTEVDEVVLEALDVHAVGGQEVDGGGLKRERPRRVAAGDDGEDQTDHDREQRVVRGVKDQAGQGLIATAAPPDDT
jgi:hypothetical protein